MSELQTLATALAGRYEVEREIGAGGMATVYLARDQRHGRQVAIKVLRPDIGASLGLERFHREIQVAAALQHPHIVPLFDSGDANGLLYYVMPFLPGTSLRDRLQREGELPINEAVRILRDVADAIAAAHDHGIVHRDLKPDNVMLSGRHAMVTDFGVAKAVSDSTGKGALTTMGVALGTPTYMSPEQATADPHLDHRTDIYAFGVMAYELLTGSPPFTGKSQQEILAAHVTAPVAPITTHRAAIPPQLASLVMRCLEKKPADRWQRAEELIPALETVFTPSGGFTPTDTVPMPAVSGASAPVRPRRRWVLPAAITTSVLAAAVFAGSWWMSREQPVALDPAKVVVVPFEVRGGGVATPGLASFPELLESSITQGLQRTGLGAIADSRTASAAVAFRDTAMAQLATVGIAQRLARANGAGLVVVGSILVLGDSVRVEGKLLSAESGSEVVAIAPQVGAIANAAALAEEVTQRMMGAYVMHRDPAWGTSLPGTRAPTYAAYRQYQEGNGHFARAQYVEAEERFRRAIALDTTFLVGAVRMGYALYNLRRYEAVESLGVAFEPKRALLSPFETQYLNRLLAWNEGNLEGMWAAARAMARAAPASNFARYTAARSAMMSNRLAEARAGLDSVDVDSPDMSGVASLFSDLADVVHLLGDGGAYATVAERWVKHPRNERPLSVHVALGVTRMEQRDWAGVEAEFSQLLTAKLDGNATGFYLANRLLAELRWHGHDSVATRLSQSALQRVQEGIPTADLIPLEVFAGNLARARTRADSVARLDTAAVTILAYRGALAADLGDRATALAIAEQMGKQSPKYQQGRTTRLRAGVYAHLGEKAQAVQLLRQAHAEGAAFSGIGYHANYLLEPLRGDPGFEAFVKGK